MKLYDLADLVLPGHGRLYPGFLFLYHCSTESLLFFRCFLLPTDNVATLQVHTLAFLHA